MDKFNAHTGRTSPKKPKTNLWLVLIGVIFAAGLLLTGYFLLKPGTDANTNSSSPNQIVNNGGGNQDDDGKVYRNSGGNEDNGENITVGGDGQNDAPNGAGGPYLRRAGDDGQMEYSTDGGKTWSKTKPADAN